MNNPLHPTYLFNKHCKQLYSARLFPKFNPSSIIIFAFRLASLIIKDSGYN